MPMVEGDSRTGWLVLFSETETAAVAKSTDKAAFLASLLPEPSISTILSLSATAVGLAARFARKQDMALGVRLKIPGSNLKMPGADWKRALHVVSELTTPAVLPFFYSEHDPESLDRLRKLYDF